MRYSLRHGGLVLAAQPSLFHVIAWLGKPGNVEMVVGKAELPAWTIHAGNDEPVATVTSDSYGRIGVKLHRPTPTSTADKIEIIEAYFLEAVQALPECKPVPRPEGMLSSDWEALSVVGDVAYGCIPFFDDGQNPGYSVQTQVESMFLRRVGYPRNGPHDQDFGSNRRHEVHVEYALAAGRPVPDEVIAEYRLRLQDTTRPSGIERFFRALLEWPRVRGAFKSVGLGAVATRLLDKEGVSPLDADLLLKAASHLATLPDRAHHGQIDDALYAAGLIKPGALSVPTAEPVDPFNDFASALRNRLAESQSVQAMKELDGNDSMSRRERECRIKHIDAQRKASLVGKCDWADRLAKALDARDLRTLLGMLAGTGSQISKKLIQERYGVKLVGVNAEKRRAAIFKLAGIEQPEEVAKAEAWLKAVEAEEAEAKRIQLMPQALEQARRVAAISRYHLPEAGTVTGAEYVERRVSEGFTSITTRKRGSVNTYWLMNAEKGAMCPLQVDNGTKLYAELLLASKAQAAAQSNEVAEAA